METRPATSIRVVQVIAVGSPCHIEDVCPRIVTNLFGSDSFGWIIGSNRAQQWVCKADATISPWRTNVLSFFCCCSMRILFINIAALQPWVMKIQQGKKGYERKPTVPVSIASLITTNSSLSLYPSPVVHFKLKSHNTRGWDLIP